MACVQFLELSRCIAEQLSQFFRRLPGAAIISKCQGGGDAVRRDRQIASALVPQLVEQLQPEQVALLRQPEIQLGRSGLPFGIAHHSPSLAAACQQKDS
ncbi:hypothetical protein D3C86_1883380 [compost metagenome]